MNAKTASKPKMTVQLDDFYRRYKEEKLNKKEILKAVKADLKIINKYKF